MSDITVLMTVYAKTPASDLKEALASVWRQTSPPKEVILVADGPLEDAHEDLLAAESADHPELKLIRLPVNGGAGPALQAGLEEVATTYVARLDADDLAFPERLEKQRALIEELGVDVLGTAVHEFDDETFRTTGDLQQALGKVRSLPTSHDEIVRYARLNTPVNHPSVLLRADSVRAAGGYRGVHYMEDYDLWARMLSQGCRFHNLPEPLTYFRTSDSQFARRTGREMFASERQMQSNLVAYGLVSRPRAVVNFVVRSGYRMIPQALLRRVYSVLFHRAR